MEALLRLTIRQEAQHLLNDATMLGLSKKRSPDEVRRLCSNAAQVWAQTHSHFVEDPQAANRGWSVARKGFEDANQLTIDALVSLVRGNVPREEMSACAPCAGAESDRANFARLVEHLYRKPAGIKPK